MNFQESDIDFEKIDWGQFEELCFDLLMKHQFHDMIWHQGSADAGRDIEALSTVVNPLIGPFSEKWFFECKFYSNGVPMKELVSKIGWATAHRVNHFVLMTNTHPTKDTRDYLNLTQKSVNFNIHVIDGKAIKAKLLAFPDLIVKYFADDTIVWVNNLIRQWLFQNALPEVKTLAKLAPVVDPKKLTKEQLVFLMMAYQQSDYDEDWLPDDVEAFDFNFLWNEIISNQNTQYPIDLNNNLFYREQNWFNLCVMSTTTEGNDRFAFAMQEDVSDVCNVQITLQRSNRQFNVKIACKKTKS